MPYTIIILEQGTEEWHAWRSQGIGASDAPAIMGENPWKSASYLLQEKCFGKRNVPNAAMVRGNELEPWARKSYVNKVGIQVEPACLQSTRHEWLRASVDGLAADKKTVVEIKCGEGVYRKASVSREVPRYYYGQLQHILAVTNLPTIDFYCYLPEQPEVHLLVGRDELYIARMIETEYLFWQQILKMRG